MRGKIRWDKQRAGVFTLTEWEIDPVHSVLLILDMQRAYVDPAWGTGKILKQRYPDIYNYYYKRLSETVLPNTLELRDFFRQHHLEVFYTCMGLQLLQGEDLAPWNWRSALLRYQKEEERSMFYKDSLEYQIVSELQPLPNELVLDKNSLNPFYSTGLSQILKNMSLENLVISGVLTNAAVESTARTGGDRGYNVIVVEDACAAYYNAEHEAALRSPPTTSFIVKTTEEIFSNFSPLLMIS